MKIKISTTNEIEKYSEIDKEIIKDLRKILHEWKGVNSEYYKMHDCKESLLDYTEVSVIGSLIAAIARCPGMFSLAEFQTEKGSSTIQTYRGRGDLYFGSKNYGAILEAKYLNNIDTSSRRAIDDIKRHKPDTYNYYIALGISKTTSNRNVCSAMEEIPELKFVEAIIAELQYGSSKYLALSFTIYKDK